MIGDSLQKDKVCNEQSTKEVFLKTDQMYREGERKLPKSKACKSENEKPLSKDNPRSFQRSDTGAGYFCKHCNIVVKKMYF